MDFAPLLDDLRQLARLAGAAVLDVYGQDFDVDRKADASPVTEADLRSERIILEGLARLTPSLPVVSEEAAAAGVRPDIGQGHFWLVDPLDGTKEFVKRNGEFTVNIGLVWDGAPRVGILFAPALARLFSAIPGQAWVEDGATAPRPIHCRLPPADGLVVLSSRSHRNPDRFDDFLRPFRVAATRHTGSSLKFAEIAAGEADLYPRFGPTMEWDTAAGHAILLAAGGSLSTLDEQPLRYGKPGFINPEFIAQGAPQPEHRKATP
jgi:3'(2'), 5'-bisphosphate nucleotidase